MSKKTFVCYAIVIVIFDLIFSYLGKTYGGHELSFPLEFTVMLPFCILGGYIFHSSIELQKRLN